MHRISGAAPPWISTSCCKVSDAQDFSADLAGTPLLHCTSPFWHKCEVPRCPLCRPCCSISGRNAEHDEISAIDPIETWAAQDFRSAKALFVPSLKRDIVSSVACTRPPAGGSHGNPHPTARIHIHTGQRSSRVAACGARAAGRAHAAHRRALGLATDDPDNDVRLAAFQQRLQQLGWTVGDNVRIDYRLAAGDAETIASMQRNWSRWRQTSSWPLAVLVAPMLQATRTVPIVFVTVIDPVGAGFVASLARPGGNATGFTNYEYSISGKWLELLKEIAPGVTRAAVLRDPTVTAGIGQFGAVQIVAPSLGVELSPVDVRDAHEIERAVTAFARGSNGGLIVTASTSGVAHRELITTLAARHKLPAVYSARHFVTAGGLISYGPIRRPVPACGRLRRPYPQGRETCRSSGAGADQVRAGHQPQDRQGARPGRAADAARPRRRGDRMKRRELFVSFSSPSNRHFLH